MLQNPCFLLVKNTLCIVIKYCIYIYMLYFKLITRLTTHFKVIGGILNIKCKFELKTNLSKRGNPSQNDATLEGAREVTHCSAVFDAYNQSQRKLKIYSFHTH